MREAVLVECGWRWRSRVSGCGSSRTGACRTTAEGDPVAILKIGGNFWHLCDFRDG